MKKLFPFLMTGVVSILFAFLLFSMFNKPVIIHDTFPAKSVFTNFSPVEETGPSAGPSVPNLVTASNFAKQAVVYIESREASRGYFGRQIYGGSTGSGVIISPDGYIATNRHVVADGNEFAVLTDDGREYKAKLLGMDPATDLALLKVDEKKMPFLAFGNSDSLMVGEWVLAIGNPFRLYSTVTAGIVSAKARNINILENGGIENFIQTDAAVNPGNSGGALVNAKGQLMGINTAIMTYSGQYEGFSFAIPANLARKVLEDIRLYGSPKRGWLGVVISPVDAQTAKAQNLDEVAGVVLEKINSGSAAETGGLKQGDIILYVNDRKIKSTPDFMGQIGEHHPGDELMIRYLRDGKIKESRIVLGETSNFGKQDIADARAPELILEDIGMTVRDFNEYEEARLSKPGIVVSEIRPGSQIDDVNMDRKFIITRLNGIPVASVKELKQALGRSGNELYFQGYYENYPGDFAYNLTVR